MAITLALFFLYPKLSFTCESLSSTVLSAPNWLQCGISNYFHPITPGVKPSQQVLKPRCACCKALSIPFGTVLHDGQTHFNNCQTHFSRSVKSFQ